MKSSDLRPLCFGFERPHLRFIGVCSCHLTSLVSALWRESPSTVDYPNLIALFRVVEMRMLGLDEGRRLLGAVLGATYFPEFLVAFASWLSQGRWLFP